MVKSENLLEWIWNIVSKTNIYYAKTYVKGNSYSGVIYRITIFSLRTKKYDVIHYQTIYSELIDDFP